jgi:hypothetical protein
MFAFRRRLTAVEASCRLRRPAKSRDRTAGTSQHLIRHLLPSALPWSPGTAKGPRVELLGHRGSPQPPRL